MTEFAGWISSISLALCAYPQVIHTWRTGKTDGLSVGFLVLWLLGEVFGLIYVTGFDTIPLPLLANYAANTLAIGYLLWHTRKNTTRQE
jgi:uncharacterized protein with PQ loop repeat